MIAPLWLQGAGVLLAVIFAAYVVVRLADLRDTVEGAREIRRDIAKRLDNEGAHTAGELRRTNERLDRCEAALASLGLEYHGPQHVPAGWRKKK